MKKNKVTCFVAGKSAGHILPACTLAKKIKECAPHQKILFFSNHTKLDKNILQNNKSIDYHTALNLIQLPYRSPWKLPKFAFQFCKSIWQSYWTLKRHKPNQIISTGGMVSIPVCLAGYILKIPITVYELNVQPGKATKLLSYFASQIKICFKKTRAFLPAKKCILSSYPTRFDTQDYKLPKAKAVNFIKQDNYNFNLNHKTILIIGGSQGSLFINGLIKKFIKQYPYKSQLQIIHQVGQNDNFDWHKFYTDNQVEAIAFSYQSNLMHYYIAADIIICRAGAGTLAEVVPLNTPCVTIPLETSYTNHQLENALETANEHLHVNVLKQSDIQNNFNRFYSCVSELLN